MITNLNSYLKRIVPLFLFIILFISPVFASVDIISKDKIERDNYEIGLDINIDDFEDSEIKEFDLIEIGNEGYTNEVGKPKIPVIRRLVSVPSFSDISLEINEGDYVTYYNYDMIPVQEPLPDVANAKINFTIDEEFYSRDKFYPEQRAKIENQGVIRDHKVIQLEIFPFEYNPDKKELRFYKNIEVKLKYEGKYPNTNNKKELLRDFYGDIILNYDSTENWPSEDEQNLVLQSESGERADYLVITYDSFYNSILPLVSLKEEKGLETKIVETSQILDVNANGLDDIDIYSYIYNAYHTWELPPTYVLLVGDVETVPTHYGLPHSYYGGEKVATDHYYSTVDGNDYFSDVFVGRLSVKSSSELDVVVDKIIKYEKTPYIDGIDWYRKAMLYHGLERNVWYETSQFIKSLLTSNGFTYIDMFNDDSHSTADVINAINNGRSFLNYRGHGTKTKWANTPFDNSDILALNNGMKLPVVISPTCEAGWFDYRYSDSFGETWLKAGTMQEKKGGIAFFGASRVSYSYYNDELSRGVYKGIFNDGLNNLGKATNKGKIYMYNYYGEGGTTHLQFELFNLLGDPEMEVPPKISGKPVAVYNDGDSDLIVTSVTGPSWTTINPTSFTVPAHSSKIITVVINDFDLNPGNYNSDISIYSNDPDNSVLDIPISLSKSGNNPPEIDPELPDLSTDEGVSINFDLTPYENDVEDSGTSLDWSVSDVNTELFTASVNQFSDVLTINPISGASGTDEILLILTDSDGATDTEVITITIISSPDFESPIINLIQPINSSLDKYTIFKYNVSDKSEINNCSLFINGITTQADNSVTREVSQYFYEVLLDGNYNWSINCIDSSENNNEGISEEVSFEKVVSPAKILLIDDDKAYNSWFYDYEQYYQNALFTNDYLYHNWNVDVLGSPNITNLIDYDILIWFTGDSISNTLTQTDQDNLKSYLDNGGNLFISGQDIGYDLTSYGAINNTFLSDYFHVAYAQDDANIYNLDGIAGTFTEGIEIDIYGSNGANNQRWPSEIDPIYPAEFILLYDESEELTERSFENYFNINKHLRETENYEDPLTVSSGSGGIRVDNGTYKVVYFSFGFEAINSETDRNILMQNIIGWLGSDMNITCNNDSECDEDGFVGELYCMEGNVYQTYVETHCMNPGAINSFCSGASSFELIEECEYRCSGGFCVEPKDKDKDEFCELGYEIENALVECSKERGQYGTDCDDNNSNILPPYNNMRIINNTMFCNGSYELPGGISMGSNNIILDCNNATLMGDGIFYGIEAYSKNGIEIKNCNLRNYSISILFSGSSNGKIINNKIYYSERKSISLWSDSNNNYVTNNSIYESGDGFFIEGSSNNLLQNNNVINATWDSYFIGFGSNNNILKDNEGISADQYYGLSLQDGARFNLIEGNSFSGANYGVMLHSYDNITDNSFISNTIYDNGEGFYVGTESYFNNFTNNNLYNQTYYSLIVYGSNNNIWENNIYNKPIYDYEPSNNNYCINNTGNYYFDEAYGPICEIMCFNNSGCGEDGFIDSTYCVDDNIYQEYQEYECINQGTEDSDCLSNLSSQLIEVCATGSTGIWNEDYCHNNDIYHNRTVINAGCLLGECHNNEFIEEELVKKCNNGEFCENGICLDIPTRLIINSPTLNLFDERRIPLNLQTTEEVDEIVYTYLDSRGRLREKRLCRNCDEYNRKRSFSDGFYDLTFKAIVEDIAVDEKSVSFTIDSKDPRISKTSPTRGFSDGNFYVEFKENNPVNLTLYYGNSIRAQELDIENNCSESRGKYSCSVWVNLSDFDNKEIEYWFELKDIARNTDESRKRNVDVDMTFPVLNNPDSFWEMGTGRYDDYVYFDISITEKNFDKVVLSYDYRGRTREKRLCSRLRYGSCEKKFKLRDGYSNYQLIVMDDAGNVVARDISF